MIIEVRKPSQFEIDEAHTWPIWSKEASEFDWTYASRETCLIIEGRAEVSTSQGEKVTFGAGDWVVFPVGLDCHWKVLELIKKHYRFD